MHTATLTTEVHECSLSVAAESGHHSEFTASNTLRDDETYWSSPKNETLEPDPCCFLVYRINDEKVASVCSVPPPAPDTDTENDNDYDNNNNNNNNRSNNNNNNKNKNNNNAHSMTTTTTSATHATYHSSYSNVDTRTHAHTRAPPQWPDSVTVVDDNNCALSSESPNTTARSVSVSSVLPPSPAVPTTVTSFALRAWGASSDPKLVELLCASSLADNVWQSCGKYSLAMSAETQVVSIPPGQQATGGYWKLLFHSNHGRFAAFHSRYSFYHFKLFGM